MTTSAWLPVFALLPALAGLTLTLTLATVDATASSRATQAEPTAPPTPDAHVAPAGLISNVLRVACEEYGNVCDDAKRAEVVELARRWNFVGQWYVDRTPGMPAYMAWWLPAHAYRESRSSRALVGDHGKSIGDFHLQAWAIKFWRNHTGRTLDRNDPLESARALMHAVALSFTTLTPRACGRQPRDRRARLAAARVGRGPRKRNGDTRCDFTFWSKSRNRFVHIAGVPVKWSREWFERSAAAARRAPVIARQP